MSERTTSAAKAVEMDYGEYLLSIYGEISRDFNAQSQQQAAVEQDREGMQENGSSMVREDAPEPVHRPPPEIAKPVDRENFDERWKAEQEKAAAEQEYLQQLVEAYENDKSLHNDRGRDYEHDFSR